MSASRSVAVGDRLILRMKEDFSRELFTKPLRHGKTVQSQWGSIPHDSLIGKFARDTVASSTGRKFQVHVPTLEEYVTLTPRIVTPVYPTDASLIVSLLDIHVVPYQSASNERPLEILEAGTGHGSLTLHLARAVSGANPAPLAESLEDSEMPREGVFDDGSPSGVVSKTNKPAPEVLVASETEGSTALAKQEWRASRRCVIHTVDISATYSQHAEGVVRGFRQGMYAANVDFHVANVSEWVDEQFKIRNVDNLEVLRNPFLSHAILDLPRSHDHIAQVAAALHTDGILIAFNPSLTQIIDCIKSIIAEEVPLWLDKVVELGAGMTGGREWDVRTVKPRALLKAERRHKEAELASGSVTDSLEARSKNVEKSRTLDEEQSQAISRSGTGWEMICRPKVGERVVGGGFLGVWRKMADRGSTHNSEG
ncbi:hypothetical protein MMC17_003485 [Xylographa soralifera]|nr:hypothetical protein [Xylographa soralifera]